MCGIAGILWAGQSPSWLQRTAVSMADALHHRGPDAGGMWSDATAGVALSHRRLSIVDLSPTGAQPMHSASGRFVISFNGEVYNFGALRRELEGHGATFRGTSDTEVMLAAFEAWGIADAVQRFIGMFAFAVWDTRERALHLVRDRVGVKPLFWARQGGMFLFGSELKALQACEPWQPCLDRGALRAYVRWGYIPSPNCIFEGAAKLAPGCILTVRAGGEPSIRRYWDMRAIAREAVAPIEDDAEAATKLEDLISDAVRLRLVADVPVGAFLSGGTDSSLVVALMQKQSASPVRSYSIGFAEREYDEAPFAKAVAAHLGTDHTELYVSADDALGVVPDLATHYDEPFADSSQIPTLLVSTLTRRHVTVALSGDGGDELFAGYTRYHWAEMVRHRFMGWPPAARRAMASALDAVPRAVWETGAALVPGRRYQRVGERVGKLANFLRAPDADAIYRGQHSQWPDPSALVIGGREPRGLPFDATLAAEIPDFVRRMQFLDLHTYLPDDILTKVDRASMAVSLEAREPLLDHRLVEFAWHLPQRMKVRNGVTKWLMREVLYRHVPRKLIERPKMGFSVPLARWLRGPLRQWAEALLDPVRLRDGGHFDTVKVRSAWQSFQSGRTSNQDALWCLLMFEAWRDRYAQRPVVQPSAAGTR